MLYKLAESTSSKTDLEDFEKMIEYTLFSNKVGAITCTQYGAMEAMPTIEQIAISN